VVKIAREGVGIGGDLHEWGENGWRIKTNEGEDVENRGSHEEGNWHMNCCRVNWVAVGTKLAQANGADNIRHSRLLFVMVLLMKVN